MNSQTVIMPGGGPSRDFPSAGERYPQTDVLPEGTIHIITPIDRKLGRKRQNNASDANNRLHGRYTGTCDVHVFPNELVLTRKPEHRSVDAKHMSNAYYGFTSTTGLKIPPGVSSQADFEDKFRFHGFALAPFLVETPEQNGNEFAVACRGKTTIWNTGNEPILTGELITYELRPIDVQEQLDYSRKLPPMPEPMPKSKFVPITKPLRHDQIHRTTEHVHRLLRDGTHLGTRHEKVADALQSYIVHCVLQGVTHLLAQNVIQMAPTRPNFAANPPSVVSGEDVIALSELLGVLPATNRTQKLATDIVTRGLLQEILAPHSVGNGKSGSARHVTEEKDLRQKSDIEAFEKTAVEKFQAAQQQLHFDIQERIIGQARSDGAPGSKMDVMV